MRESASVLAPVGDAARRLIVAGRRRALGAAALRGAAIGAAIGFLASTTVVLIARLWPVQLADSERWLLFVPPVLGAALGAAIAARRAPRRDAVARLLDHAHSLDDRLATLAALDRGARADRDFASLIGADAARRTAGLAAATAIPLRLATPLAALGAAACGFAGAAWFVPQRSAPVPPPQPPEQLVAQSAAAEALRESIARVRAVEQRQPDLDATMDAVDGSGHSQNLSAEIQERLAELDRIAQQLDPDASEPPVTAAATDPNGDPRKEAVDALDALADRLDQSASLAADEADARARQFSSLGAVDAPASAQTFAEAMRAGRFDDAAEALRVLEQSRHRLSPADREELARYFESLANEAQQLSTTDDSSLDRAVSSEPNSGVDSASSPRSRDLEATPAPVAPPPLQPPTVQPPTSSDDRTSESIAPPSADPPSPTTPADRPPSAPDPAPASLPSTVPPANEEQRNGGGSPPASPSGAERLAEALRERAATFREEPPSSPAPPPPSSPPATQSSPQSVPESSPRSSSEPSPQSSSEPSPQPSPGTSSETAATRDRETAPAANSKPTESPTTAPTPTTQPARPASTPAEQQRSEGPTPRGAEPREATRRPDAQAGEPPPGAESAPGQSPPQAPGSSPSPPSAQRGTEGQREAQPPAQAPGQTPGQAPSQTPGQASGQPASQQTPGTRSAGESSSAPDVNESRGTPDASQGAGQAAGEGASDETPLSQALRDVGQRRAAASQSRANAQSLREQADRLAASASPQERRELERWASAAAREQGTGGTERPSGRPSASNDDQELARSAGTPTETSADRVGASPPLTGEMPPRAEQPAAPGRATASTDPEQRGRAADSANRLDMPPAPRVEGRDSIDLRGRAAGDVVAEWFDDLPPGESAGTAEARVASRVESARRAAERAIDRSAVPSRYHELVRRYFGRLDEAARDVRPNSATDAPTAPSSPRPAPPLPSPLPPPPPPPPSPGRDAP